MYKYENSYEAIRLHAYRLRHELSTNGNKQYMLGEVDTILNLVANAIREDELDNQAVS